MFQFSNPYSEHHGKYKINKKIVVPGFGSYIFISDHLHHQRFTQRRTEGCTKEPPQLPVVESSIPAINDPQLRAELISNV